MRSIARKPVAAPGTYGLLGGAPMVSGDGGRQQATVTERSRGGRGGLRGPRGRAAHQRAHAVVGEARGGRPAAQWCSAAGGRRG